MHRIVVADFNLFQNSENSRKKNSSLRKKVNFWSKRNPKHLKKAILLKKL